MKPTNFGTAIYTALPYFLQMEAVYLEKKDQVTFEGEMSRSQNSFDFIIVGGGTAGCVLANRLSAQFTVLLLEAGGDPPSAASVPAFVIATATSPTLNYVYKSVPQKHLQNRILDKTMGKMLGGSGSHNGLIYNRGHPRDFDNWAKIVNDTSWKYEQLLKYFKKLENYVGIWPRSGQHGKNGPIQVETESSIFRTAWKAAAKQLGYKYGDPNGPQQIEFSPKDVTRKRGRRVSTYTAYLQQIFQRKNLTVFRYVDVNQLLISKGKVIGVEYLRHGHKFKAFASKETVISAGTFGTPLLLFKSGIGPAGMLRRAGIKLKLNLPAVGKYLQDHIGATTLPFTPNAAQHTTAKETIAEAEFEKFIKFGKGRLLSDFLGPQALIASSVAKGKGESDWPDIHILGGPCSTELTEKSICFGASATRPIFSRALAGSLKLNTTLFRMGERDDVKLAIIDDKALKSRDNRRIIREGLIFARQILRTRGMKRLGKLQAVDVECGARFKVNSVQYWNCYITRTATSQYHTVGTCRMGLSTDRKSSVVDSKLRVHGLRGLRIADASVIPINTNANTNTPVIVIAEKAADMLISHNTQASRGILMDN